MVARRAQSLDIRELAARLDAMSHAGRVAETLAWPRPMLAQVFAAAAASAPLTFEALVPAGTPALTPVRHVGKNDMPVFRLVEKPMYRDARGVVCGRNVQSWQAFSGPGYFTAQGGEGGELVLDYVELPREVPSGWPAVQSNARGLSFFIFRGLRDYVRRVSAHVCIGHATRLGKDLPQHFLLVREG